MRAALLLTLLWALPANAATYYVSTTGSSANPGTSVSPWSLRYAFAGAGGTLTGDDVVCLQAGTYFGHFTITASGTTGHPVTFKACDYAAVKIDGNFNVTTTGAIGAVAAGASSTIGVTDTSDLVVGGPMIFDPDSPDGITITSISGLAVTGTRGCGAGTCPAHPGGVRVWTIQPMITTDLSAHDVTLWGLEVLDSGTDFRVRTVSSNDAFSNANGRRRDGLATSAPRTTLIDCVIHDAINGLGAWTQCTDCKYSGLVIYNNGYMAPDRGHGHGIYTQNDTGTKLFQQVVSFNNYGFAHQFYGSSAASLKNETWDQYVTFNTNNFSPNYNLGALWGGESSMSGIVVKRSHFYRAGVYFGYIADNSGPITIQENKFRSVVSIGLAKLTTVDSNTFWGTGDPNSVFLVLGLTASGSTPADFSFTNNTYFKTNSASPFHQFVVQPDPAGDGCGRYWFNHSASGYGFCGGADHGWQERFGYDAGGSYSASQPTGSSGTTVLVDPYDSRRNTVVIYNWDLADTVNVTPTLPAGRYFVRNVANYYGDVTSTSYAGSGPLTFTMTGHSVALPSGGASALGANTFPEFGVFILEPDEAPKVTAVTPSSGSGPNQIFTYAFSDPNGYTDISWTAMPVMGAGSNCVVVFARAANELYLLDDAGTALLGPAIAGGGGTVQNSQCSLAGASSFSAGSTNDLTVSLAMAFRGAFAGDKTTLAVAHDTGGHTSGWRLGGTYTVTNAAPAVTSVTPSSGSGSTQTFSYLFADANGYADIASAAMLIFTPPHLTDSCLAYFDRKWNALLLLDDAGSAWLGPALIGGGGTLENSRCSLNATGSSISGAGNDLTLSLALTFKSPYTGTHFNVALTGDSSLSSGWQVRGTWTVP